MLLARTRCEATSLTSNALSLSLSLSLCPSLLTRCTCSQSGTVTRASSHAIHRGTLRAATHRETDLRPHKHTWYLHWVELDYWSSKTARRQAATPLCFTELSISCGDCFASRASINVLQRVARRSTVTAVMTDDVPGSLMAHQWQQTAGRVRWLGITSLHIRWHIIKPFSSYTYDSYNIIFDKENSSDTE